MTRAQDWVSESRRRDQASRPEHIHDCEEEVPVQGVVGLSEVQERHETGPPLLGQEVGEVAEEEDIGPDEAAR